MVLPALHRHALTLSLLAALTLASAKASAGPTYVRAEGAPGSCSTVGAGFTRWTSADGPPARFIVNTFFSEAPSADWIGLGYTDEGFWTAEAYTPNDACDDCSLMDLVVTGFDGKRRSFPLITSIERNRITDRDARRNHVLQRLWTLASKDWPVAKLRHDYDIRFAPNRNVDGLSNPYPGWMAETSKRGSWLLRYALASKGQMMCWCLFGWKSWTLAAPAKR